MEDKVTREQIQKKLADKRAENKYAYMDLLRMGRELDPTHMLMTRLDALIGLILTEEQRELFELAFETELSKKIAEAKLDATRDTITPVLMKPGIIQPGGF